MERTGVLLVLDVANVYANARNRGRDPLRELARLPVERVAYSHVAGGHEGGDFYHDTHTAPTPAAVLDLVTALRERVDTPFMLERDGRYPLRVRPFGAQASRHGTATLGAGAPDPGGKSHHP